MKVIGDNGRRHLHFKLVRDGDGDMLFCSPVQNNGDWNYRLWLKLQYTAYWSEEWARDVGPYHVEIHAVSAEAAGEEQVKSAAESMCIELDELKAMGETMIEEALLDYGVSAVLYQETGKNKDKLLQEARNQAQIMPMMFGFYMDAPINRIGATGWDFIAGNPTAPLERMSS